MKSFSRLSFLLSLLSMGLLLLPGCGGGGGGTPNTFKGTILRGENGIPESPSATIVINGRTATTDVDGKFTLLASGSPTVAVISAQGTQTRTLSLPTSITAINDLGTIYLTDNAAGYTASITGRVVDLNTNLPIPSAAVVFAGSHAVTGVDGVFAMDKLPVDFGLALKPGTIIGTITATGYGVDLPIRYEQLIAPLGAGANPLGDFKISTGILTTPPDAPFNLKGVVTVNGAKPTTPVNISIASGGNTLITGVTDSNGGYSAWMVPGIYTVTASQSGLITKSVNVTLVKSDSPVTAPVINLTP